MSEDSKQLSVAELLARNGQQGAASSGGGGRRRRSGRGISVAELTGDLPVIGGGGSHSAHAAPDPEEPAYEPPSFESVAYQPPSFETAAPEPVSYAPAEPAPYLSSYSPMSGPISMYDPLTSYAAPEPPAAEPLPPPGRSNRVMPGRDMPASRHSSPSADLYESVDPYSTDPLSTGGTPALGGGHTGRRHRYAESDYDPPDYGAPDYEAPEVRPLREVRRPESNGRRASDTALPDRNGWGGRAARRRAAEAAETAAEPPIEGRSPSTNGFAPESAPLPLSAPPGARGRGTQHGRFADIEPPAEPNRRSSRRDGLPTRSVRRLANAAPPDDDHAPESGGISTGAWSLANQDQQLLSGQTVAGDLLRDGAARAGRAKRDAILGPEELVDFDDLRTDVYAPIAVDDGPLEDNEHDAGDEPATGHQAAGRSVARRSRAARKAEQDANRRQWMILGGQSTGAAVVGMLLFKGFERMWEMLPWVALALAMIVILGLVALVRILRRTDDILSTVIAVVVGIFVTMGPLAFLLSTN